MENKELIQKLNSLRCLKPDKEWKERNREILFSQISSAAPVAALESNPTKIFILPQRLARFFATPAWAVFFVCLIIVAGSVFSVRAARLTKPDSSLYIARIISEKAQLAVTFGEEKKAKLSFKFANDHAKDITEILAKTDFGDESNKAKTEKLSENFKEEIKVAKTKLKEMGISTRPNAESQSPEQTEEIKVFSANLKKEEQGMQVSEPKAINNEAVKNENQTDNDNIIKTPAEEKATNTPADKVESYAGDSGDAHKILEEAEELFDEKDYGGTLNKLEEVDALVENINAEEKGEVKGVSDGATSTEEYRAEK